MNEIEYNERMKQLLNKSPLELCDIIIKQEEEIHKSKEYRTRLLKILNLATEPENRRQRGRPRKDEKVGD